jgi:hypothetical protein
MDKITMISAEDSDQGRIFAPNSNEIRQAVHHLETLYRFVAAMHESTKDDQEGKVDVQRAYQHLQQARSNIDAFRNPNALDVDLLELVKEAELDTQDMINVRYWVIEKAKIRLDAIQESKGEIWTEDTLGSLGEMTAACYEGVRLWPPLRIARRLELMTTRETTTPMRGLLRVDGHDAWERDRNCDCEEAHGDHSFSEFPISVETGIDDELNYKCLSMDGESFTHESTAISEQLQKRFLEELAVPMRELESQSAQGDPMAQERLMVRPRESSVGRTSAEADLFDSCQ